MFKKLKQSYRMEKKLSKNKYKKKVRKNDQENIKKKFDPKLEDFFLINA